MRLLVFIALLLFSTFASGVDRRSFVVADPQETGGNGVRITYLGTNGYLLESGRTKLLVDPYFTRIPLAAAAFNRQIHSDPKRVNSALRRLPSRIDAILVTHGHFDHLLDVPPIAQRTGARVFASRSSVYLASAAGLARSRSTAVEYGERYEVGAARITALRAAHDRLFCQLPFPGTLDRPPRQAPGRPKDWVCGEPLAFLIEIGGRRIYVDSGGTPEVPPPREIGRVDLAILGVALADSRQRLGAALASLRPRYFLPSHQDDFFRPMDRGFVFGNLTDFPGVVRIARRYPTRLIMLDYFRPWTLR